MIPRVLWGSLIMSQVAYLAVAHVSVRAGGPGPSFVQILVGAAIMSALAAYFLPRVIAHAAVKQRLTEGRTLAELSLTDLLPLLFAPLLVRWALIESISVFGLVAAFMSNDLQAQYPFAAAGILGMLLNFPSESKVRDLAGG